MIWQSVNLSWKIVIQNAGDIFAYFCGGHKIICGHNFVAPLNIFVSIYVSTYVLRVIRNDKRANLKTGVSRKQSTSNFAKSESFLPPDTYVCVSGVRNVRFSENLACFVFLKHPFWDSLFCLITVEVSLFQRDSLLIHILPI